MEKGLLFLKIEGLDFKTVKKEEDEYFEVKGYLSTFGNIDLVDDVCVKGCFSDSLKVRTPKLLYQHEWREPVGAFSLLKEDEKGLFFEALLPLSDTFVKGRLVPQIKAGSIDSMSIGYSIVEANWDDSTGIRYLKKLDLWEGSFVTFPANPEAKLDAVKKMLEEYSSKGKCSEVLEGVEVKDFKVGDLSLKWDEAEAQKRVGHINLPELPIFDDTEKGLVIVPRALFCLKARIFGAKGGFSGDEVLAKNYINKYYQKLNLEAPFVEGASTLFCETEIKNMPVAETAFVLRNGLISKNSSDYISHLLVSTTDAPSDEAGDLEEEIKSITVEVQERIRKLKEQNSKTN